MVRATFPQQVSLTAFAFAFTLLIVPQTLADKNWPQFRGPQATGVAPDNPELPETWSATKNVAWKTDLPGRGWSSPVVWGNQIFLTSVINEGESEFPKKGLYFGGNRPKPPESIHKWMVYCLDLETGKISWERKVHEAAPKTPIHVKNSFASETPVTDGERLYVAFGGMGIFCFDLNGEQLWKHDLAPSKTRYGWGYSASPVVHDGRLYFQNDNDDQSYLLALDARTGKQLWKVDREEDSNWSSPYIWRNDKRTEIVTAGTDQVRSYDLDGKLLWWLEGMSSITIATPYVQNGLLMITSGYVGDPSKPMYAIRPGGSDNISLTDDATSNDWIAWSRPKAAPYNPSTITYKGICYVLHDFGFLAAYDASDGAEIFSKQRIKKAAGFTSSPWAYNDKLFCLDENGVTHVLKAGKEYQLVETNSLKEDDMGMATPAIVDDRLILRTSARVYCFQRQQ